MVMEGTSGDVLPVGRSRLTLQARVGAWCLSRLRGGGEKQEYKTGFSRWGIASERMGIWNISLLLLKA